MTSRIRRHGALPGVPGRKAAVAEANTTDLWLYVAFAPPEGQRSGNRYEPAVSFKQAVFQRFARKLETEMTSHGTPLLASLDDDTRIRARRTAKKGFYEAIKIPAISNSNFFLKTSKKVGIMITNQE
jgi:hypothetical protein